MDTAYSAVEAEQKKLLERLAYEEQANGGYDNWYEQLEPFRNSLKPYIAHRFPGYRFRIKHMKTASGDLVDHHIISYLAPMTYRRTGWENVKRTPEEQILYLGNYLKKQGVRFLYVALPNKGVIYPEIITQEKNCRMEGGNAPQYRKMLQKIVRGGVEVIDLLPDFMKSKSKDLFRKGHNITSQGAKIVADKIAAYLNATTEGLDELKQQSFLQLTEKTIFQLSLSYPYKELGYLVTKKNKEAYWNQEADESKIAIFGDCNLQGYQEIGGGIGANLAYNLQYPVYNMGRFLPFDHSDPITRGFIEEMKKKKIIIYVAFSSAGFVRSSVISYRNMGRIFPWSTISLE